VATINTISVERKKNWRQFACYNTDFDSDEMQLLLQDPDTYCHKNQVEVFKANPGDTTWVGIVQCGERQFVVKRYNIKGFLHRLKRAFLPSKAWVSWKNALALLQADIKTPSLVAVIEQRFGPLRGAAFFITEYLQGTKAMDYFQSPEKPYWQLALNNLKNMAQQLAAAGILHRDFQCHNILFVDNEPYLIDLDHMSVMPQKSAKFIAGHQYDLDRLRRSFVELPEAKALWENIVE